MDFVQLAVDAIAAERRRQIEAEGRTAEHDDQYRHGELSLAGACYLESARAAVPPFDPTPTWPWDAEWWKPKGVEPDMIRAGALFKAEIDRLNRLTTPERRRGNAAYHANVDLSRAVEGLAVLYRFAHERAQSGTPHPAIVDADSPTP